MQMQRPFSHLAVSPLVAVAGAASQTVALRPKEERLTFEKESP